MSTSSGGYEVATSGESIYVRITGLASMNNAATFQDFTHEMVEAGYKRAVLDLRECRGMDSTFLGCVVRLSQELADNGVPLGESVIIVNADDHCMKVIDSLGLSAFVKVRKSAFRPPDVETKRLDTRAQAPGDRIALIRRAHQELAKIDRRNAERFGAFLAALEGRKTVPEGEPRRAGARVKPKKSSGEGKSAAEKKDPKRVPKDASHPKKKAKRVGPGARKTKRSGQG